MKKPLTQIAFDFTEAPKPEANTLLIKAEEEKPDTSIREIPALNKPISITKTTVKKPTTKTTPVVKTAVKIPGTRVKITTDFGVMIVRLYDKTPQHRDNFIKLANEHFFDSLLLTVQKILLKKINRQKKTMP